MMYVTVFVVKNPTGITKAHIANERSNRCLCGKHITTVTNSGVDSTVYRYTKKCLDAYNKGAVRMGDLEVISIVATVYCNRLGENVTSVATIDAETESMGYCSSCYSEYPVPTLSIECKCGSTHSFKSEYGRWNSD